ncbi:hypothetical protein RHMOL_Rhmol05G0091800 [Rhododendron molle]|uniref:Uncharacterized protein n=1 Tax=Rhododendron molle TaxID=49168 RepID=A0ACC0NLT3_RHOML|nr:hypothetical protein RHMOL_Rhmol05G0091800 [Rhododendron molle]
MFSCPLFLSLLALLAASLMACTYTTQIPLVKVARRVHQQVGGCRNSAQSINSGFRCHFDGIWIRGGGIACIESDGILFSHLWSNIVSSSDEERLKYYSSIKTVFLKGPFLYTFKGLAGRFAPIGVHLAMLLIMVGGTLSAAGRFKGSFTVPQGLNFIVGDVLGPSGFLSFPTEVHVNRFFIDYHDSGEDDERPFNLAMAPLKINGDKKLYGTFLPVGSPDSPDVKGMKFAGIHRPNSKLPIDIGGSKIVVVDAIGSTGLDLKTDPGVPVVYAGFGFLMLTTCISFLSHSQRSDSSFNFYIDQLVILRADAADETTILYKLRIGEVLLTVPTIGISPKCSIHLMKWLVQYKNLGFTVWDVGGKEKLRPLWRHYLGRCGGITSIIQMDCYLRLKGHRTMQKGSDYTMMKVGVEGLQILKPLAQKRILQAGLPLEGPKEAVDSSGGINLESSIVISQDDVNLRMVKWMVENLKVFVN